MNSSFWNSTAAIPKSLIEHVFAGTYVPTTAKSQGDKTSCHDGDHDCVSDKYLTSGAGRIIDEKAIVLLQMRHSYFPNVFES